MGRKQPTFVDHVVASRLQSLEDVALAEMGTVAVFSGDVDAGPYVDALAASALDNGFCVATASLAEHGLHDLHAVVAKLVASLTVPRVESGKRNGLLVALDAFVQRNGNRAEERFEEHADEEGLAGELRVHARDYIAAASGTGTTRRLQA